MDYNSPEAKRIRELQAEASRIEQEARTAKYKAAVENFKQVEGWEKKVCDAVLAALHAGESSCGVEILKPPFPPRGKPLENVSAWVSITLHPAWLTHDIDPEDIKRYADLPDSSDT